MQETLNISISADTSLAKNIIKQIATAADFPIIQTEELLIVTSELTSNLLRHAGGGQLVIQLDDSLPSIKIESYDNGPGIIDAEQAIGDGFSTAGSLGYGLGAINRLMDTLEIKSPYTRTGGTYVCCTKQIPNIQQVVTPNPFSVTISTRPYPGFDVNGDSYLSIWQDDSLLVGVIDGLGHGEFAHQAAEKIKHYVISHSHLPLERIFLGASRESRAGRGGVMALGRLSVENRIINLSYASIGNVEARVVGETVQTLPVRRGILGKGTIHPKVHKQKIQENDRLVFFSDGISTQWNNEIIQQLRSIDKRNSGRDLFNGLVKSNDDATLVIVKQNTVGTNL